MLEPQESQEIIEDAEKAKSRSRNWVALAISILAMALAINNVGGSNASKDAIQHNIEASNLYSFYQAKSIKEHSIKLAIDTLRLDQALNIEPSANGSDEPETGAINQLLSQYSDTINKYQSDEVSGEGKKQLLEKAKEQEHLRDHALRQDPWFDYAEGILQISIVLLSISIMASLPLLSLGGVFLGLIGVLCSINGFFLVLGV